MFPFVLKNLVQVHNPNMVVLVEPRIHGMKAIKIIKKLGFARFLHIEVNGVSKGI